MAHSTDDDLELYALDRLAEAASALIEEHLLVCAECRGRLANWDQYLRAMRSAMRESWPAFRPETDCFP